MYFIADAKMSLAEAFRATWITMRGAMGKVFATFAALHGARVRKSPACGVGFIAGSAIWSLTLALIYLV
jgi:hypothetical protein